MTDVKHAEVVVSGLPFRLKNEADKEEAVDAWERSLNRYLHNHDGGACGDITGHNGHHSYRVIHTADARYLNGHLKGQLSGLGFDERRVIQVQAIINAYTHLLERMTADEREKLYGDTVPRPTGYDQRTRLGDPDPLAKYEGDPA